MHENETKIKRCNFFVILCSAAESKRYYPNDLKLVLKGNILSNQCIKMKLRLKNVSFIILYSAESKRYYPNVLKLVMKGI